MKKLLISICALVAFNGLYAQTYNRVGRPKAGPAPQVNIADAKTFVLDNGLKVYVVENHKLPLVTYSIQLDIDVPNYQEKAGVKGFVGSMLTSGTKTRTKQQFLDDQDAIGASINASAYGAYGSSLVKNQDRLLELLADVILNPKFDNEELLKLKKQTISGLKMGENSAESIMANVSSVVNYGKSHPYSEVTSESSVKNINLSDISKYHRTYFKPNVAYMAVVGDVNFEEVKKLITKHFNTWQKAEVPVAIYPAVPAINATNVYFANKAGAVQSEIEISNTIQLKHKDADINSAKLMNYILGGGSSSKLFLNLREKHAWTYGAYSSLAQDKEVGYVQLTAKARNEVTDSSINEMLNEMKIMRNETVDAKLLQGAKNYLNGVFALGLRNPQTLAAYAINIDKYDLPKDYYKTYMQKTSAVTAEDIKAAANKYLTPEKTNIIVVGNRSEVEKLKRFDKDGTIDFLDAYGEPAQAIVSKVINGMNTEQVMDKALNAIGGKAAFENLTSLDSRGTTKIQGMSASFEEKISSPDKYYFGISGKVGTTNEVFVAYVINGEKGNLVNRGQARNMPEYYINIYKEKANLQSRITPELLEIVYELESYSDVDGKKAYVVNKFSKGGSAKTIQYYDATTFLLIKEVEEIANQGMVTTTTYNNYKEVKGGNGLKMPYLVETDRDGNKTVLKYDSIKANSKIGSGYFRLN